MRMPLNGVDTPTLFATLDAVKATPELARFQFRAGNRWIAGTHSRTTIDPFSGAGGEQRHAVTFEYDAEDRDGFMTTGDVADWLARYAASFAATGHCDLPLTRAP